MPMYVKLLKQDNLLAFNYEIIFWIENIQLLRLPMFPRSYVYVSKETIHEKQSIENCFAY